MTSPQVRPMMMPVSVFPAVPAGMSVVPPTMSPGQMHGGTTRHFPSAAGSPQPQFQQQPAMVPRLSPQVKQVSPQLKPAARSPKSGPSPNSGRPESGSAGVGIFFRQDVSEFICVASMAPDGAAARDGRILLGDELVGVNNVPIVKETNLQDLRDLILGDPGTYVMLALRRPGGMYGNGDADDLWYYEAELQRSEGSGSYQHQDSPKMQRSGPPAAQRAGPPPPDSGPYRNEIEYLRAQVNDLQRMKDPRREAVEQELQERISDLQRFESMYEEACEQLRASQSQHDEVKSELARLEDENQRLMQQDRERSERFEDLHRESGSHLGRLDTGLGELENELAAEKRARQDYERRTVEAEEELEQLKKEAETKSNETPHLRKKLYETHVEMLEAIRAQELQMQHLSDIIPALDMVHSSLISSISIDPVRLQSHQTTDQPRVPLMSAANFEGISLSSSLRGLPKPQRQYVPVSLSSSLRSATMGASTEVPRYNLSSTLNALPPDARSNDLSLSSSMNRMQPGSISNHSMYNSGGGGAHYARQFYGRSQSPAAAMLAPPLSSSFHDAGAPRILNHGEAYA